MERRHDMGHHGAAEAGACICPKCDTRIPHQKGVPCQDARCPACGAKMLREGSHHHDLLLKKRAAAAAG
ncbi:MAG: ferredoxin [Hyphomicrobiales bacterium]|nr:ferredoxin [Hyphomicrobiales bacterium]